MNLPQRRVVLHKLTDETAWWAACGCAAMALGILVARTGPATELERRFGECIASSHTLSGLSGMSPGALGSAGYEGWLSALLTYLLWICGGAIGASLGTAFVGLVAFVGVAYRCRRRGLDRWSTFTSVGFALVFSVGVLRQGSGGWPLLLASLLGILVEIADLRLRAAFLIALALTAAQMGPLGLLVPGWALVCVMAELFTKPFAPFTAARQFLIAAACSAAVFLTPSGLRGVLDAFASLGIPPDALTSDATFRIANFELGTPAILFSFAIASSLRLMKPGIRVAAVAAAIAGFYDLRLSACMAILIAPDVIAAFVIGSQKRHGVGVRIAAGVLVLILLRLSFASLSGNTHARQRDLSLSLVTHAVSGFPGHPRVFCAEPAWCDLILADAPDARVLIDGRRWLYPAAVRRDVAKLVQAKRGWEKILDTYGVDTIITPISGEFAPEGVLASLDPQWRVRRFDEILLLTRRAP